LLRGLGALSGFLMTVVVSHALGAQEAGDYFLALTLVTVLAAVGRVGLDQTVLRFVGIHAPAAEWGKVNTTLRTALRWSLAASLGIALLTWVASGAIADRVFQKPQLAATLQPMSIGIVLAAAGLLLGQAFQGLGRVFPAVFATSMGIPLIIAAVAPLLGSSEQLADAYPVAGAAVVAVSLLLWNRSVPRAAESIDKRALWSSCAPLWIVVVMHNLQQWSGLLFSGGFLDSADVARLAAATRTTLLVAFALTAINLVTAPRFASHYRRGELDLLRQIAQQSVRLVLVVAVPIVLVLLLWPRSVMGLFGPAFADGAPLLQVLAIGQFVNAATGSVGYLLMMSGHEKDVRNTALVCGAVALMTGYVLTASFGALGAATATAIALAAGNLMNLYYVKKRLGFVTFAIWQK
jgi:O-antigen/teichoic acid export membrane protein